MNKETAIKLFAEKQVRCQWDSDVEKWYFSIVDIIEVLTESPDAGAYWRKLKERLKKEGNETVTTCHTLKMLAADGKMRQTDVTDSETLFRLIQSIPSPKAEPIKLWLAKVGYERIEEIENPEIGIERAVEYYQKKGYSEAWINQRIKSIEVRKELTDEWKNRGVKEGVEYAILTDEITKAWSGFKVKEYKEFKNLKKENLRDNMTNLELVLNMLAEATTAEISKSKQPKTFDESKKIANQGGTIAGNTRKEIEHKTGKKIVSKLNAKMLENSEENKEIDNE
jgi:hypothetical protein